MIVVKPCWGCNFVRLVVERRSVKGALLVWVGKLTNSIRVQIVQTIRPFNLKRTLVVAMMGILTRVVKLRVVLSGSLILV